MGSAIDISMPLFVGMPAFPGDPTFLSEPLERLEHGDPYALSRLTFGSHAGTHLDPPRHFFRDGAGADRIDLDLLNGPCAVLDIPSGRPTIGAEELSSVPAGTVRLLLRTSNSLRWDRRLEFFDDYVALSTGAARRLVELGVRLVGIDALSVESGDDRSYPVHRALLGAGVVVLEGLLLATAAPGSYELACLPLRLRDGDGGPARAVLRPGAGGRR